MKKVKIIIASMFVFAIIAGNLSIVGSNFSGTFSLSGLKLAFADDIEVTVTCSAGGSGYCYEASNQHQVMCGKYILWSWDCAVNGLPDSYCIPYDPC